MIANDLVLMAALGLLVTLTIMVVGSGVLKRRKRRRLVAFVRSNARLHIPHSSAGTTFSDVAGQLEAKQELAELTEFLKNPARFQALGARMPRGVLLIGPPGCGKTLLAKAVAGEADRPFFATSGSEFMEMYAGVGAARLRDLFARARRLAPCIIFIDEIDAVGRARGMSTGMSTGEREQTLNQLLVELDGFEAHAGVIVIAATNRPDVLDPALLRPGRFDRTITIDLPSLSEREAILRQHASQRPLAAGTSLAQIARSTGGCSGAALAEIVNEAAILAVRGGLHAIGQAQLNAAAERVMLGAERRSRRPSPAERRVLAYHEAGHTLAARAFAPDAPVQEVSIIAHGGKLSVSLRPTGGDGALTSQARVADELAVTLAGRAAEELAIGEISTHGSDDIARASRMARTMVMRLGMSALLGPQLVQPASASAAQVATVDAEVAELIRAAHRRAHQLLSEQRAALDALAAALLEEETLSGARCEQLIGLSI